MACREEKPRILLVGPNPPPMGGIIKYCQDILASPLAEKYDLTFFPTSIPLSIRPAVFTAKRTWNIFLRDGFRSALRQLAFGWRRARELKELMKSGRFDVIHVPTCTGWGFWRNALHIYYARRQGVGVFFHLLGAIDDFWRNGSAVRRFFLRKALDQADIHVVQSDGLRDVTRQFTSAPVLSIYNGVPTKELIARGGYAHSAASAKKVRVVNVGLLGHRKGYFDLIEAAKILCPELPDLEFVFVGGGEVEKFRKLVAEEGLADKITVAGHVDEDEKLRWLQTSDVFAMPSYSEGQPIAILEAMAVGLPVISTTIGSIPEVIEESNGRVIAPGDVPALCNAIRELAGSKKLRRTMGKFNSSQAEERYSLQRTMTEIGSVYDRIVGMRRG